MADRSIAPLPQCLIASLILSISVSAQVDSQAIQRMAATERAFAAATAELGVRDGFLAFFAPDSIQIDAREGGAHMRVSSARDALAARQLIQLPIAVRVIWEPFTGHVSEDGTLGWLTGGFVALDQVTRKIASQGAYFSVWKKQADGTWRVWLDEGVMIPKVWRDASPFRVAPAPDTGAAGEPNEAIDEAERAVSSGGDAWRDRLASGVRLHREGEMPFVGRDAAAGWAKTVWSSVSYTAVRTETAESGDLAVTLGGYDATAVKGAQSGTWVRVWKRDTTSRWRIVFETSKPAKQGG